MITETSKQGRGGRQLDQMDLHCRNQGGNSTLLSFKVVSWQMEGLTHVMGFKNFIISKPMRLSITLLVLAAAALALS